MVKAVVSGGLIQPLEPLPADWHDGQRLRVEKADDGETSLAEIDEDFTVLSRLCDSSEAADEASLEQALLEARRQAKEQVRREMGLPRGWAGEKDAVQGERGPAGCVARSTVCECPPTLSFPHKGGGEMRHAAVERRVVLRPGN
jgi:hypothetical protein